MKGTTLRNPRQWLLAPVSARQLVFFRVLFGSFLTVHTAILMAGGTARRQYLLPKFHFPYAVSSWLPGPTPVLVYSAFGLMLLSALGISFGVKQRLSCLLYLLPQSYLFLLDRTYYENSRYLMILLVIGLLAVPANQFLSWNRDRDSVLPTTQRVHLWSLRLIVGFVYFYSGLHKLHPDWLRGQPLGIATQGLLEGTGFHPELALILSYLGLVVDLAALPGLLWNRTRSFTVGLLIVFHLLNLLLFNVTTMAVLGIVSLSLFAPPGWLKWIGEGPPGESSNDSGRFQGVATVGLLGLLILTILVPLRPILYEGDVLWNARGSRFSWILFQRRTEGSLAYRIETPGKQRVLSLRDQQLVDSGLLTPLQLSRIKADPQLILELGRNLSDWARTEQNFTNPTVYASALISLNGRKPQQLIRPSKNLAEVRNASSITFPLQRPLPDEKNLLQSVFTGE